MEVGIIQVKKEKRLLLLRIMSRVGNIEVAMVSVVLVIVFIAMLFVIPFFQDFNFRNFPKYEIIVFKEYQVKEGDTLSEIAEKFKPEHMKLKNYMVELEFKNGVCRDIRAGDRLLIPVVELR